MQMTPTPSDKAKGGRPKNFEKNAQVAEQLMEQIRRRKLKLEGNKFQTAQHHE